MSAEDEDIFIDAEEGKPDELVLEILKTEKKTREPIATYKLILIFFGIFVVSAGIAMGIAQLIYAKSTGGKNFAEWATIMLMILGGFAFSAGGVSGVWGGQRNIPIRMVSPSDSSVIGKGLLVAGYVIEDCLDNEIELTVYNKKKEIVHEELVELTEDGLFYTKLEEAFEHLEKSDHMVIEAWMVSSKSKKLRLLVREKKYEDLNIARAGLKLGKVYLFPVVFKDFTEKIKAVFDPKRKEKGFIENVKVNEERTINIFNPSKKVDDDKFVPFSFERVAEMRQNAYYFDIRRRRRGLYSLLLFGMALLYFLYPLINLISG
ncbi:MAG: hypothetical protein FK733_04555 [Asgard group archaeon]|nr:hypothetical protein [Asgard group archaeon]